MSIARWAAVGVVLLSIPLGEARATPRSDPHKRVANGLSADGGTPFQRALKAKLAERRGSGNEKKTPADERIKFEFSVSEEADGTGWGPGNCDTPNKRCPKKGYVVKAIGKTTVKFDEASEAHDPGPGKSKAKWPNLVMKNPDDPLSAVDYTEAYKSASADAIGPKGDGAPPLWKDPANPDAGGVWEFGDEPRQETIEETITFTFPEGQDQAAAFFRLLSGVSALDLAQVKKVLMGFTYTGPNVDYTIGDTAEACFIGCITLWDIKAGFALDWGLGLRLPVTHELSGPPTMVAGQTYDFFSSVTPADFAAADYAALGAPQEAGKEFVMRLSFFAGAKVEILGVDVCPYCQYVEFTNDYGTDLTTPFGEGTSFPLGGPQDIELKRWDYGIVALGLGITLTPTATSSKITAMHGADEIRHSSPGTQVPFGVKACIQGGSHEQTIDMNDYKYWLNEITVALDAWLDLQVFGYGAWNPRYGIITLDVGDMLGTGDYLYLGDHVTCDWAFHCTPAPAMQQASITSAVSDPYAPITSIALAGTAGANGWYTSGVSATFTAQDEPAGCGIGVATILRAVAPAALTAGDTLGLPSEGIFQVNYASIDKDANVEATKTREVKIDMTPPEITGAPTTAPNEHHWWNTDVTVHFTASDSVSGVASLTPDVVVTTEGANQTVTGTAENFAGLSASFTVGDIDLDKTPPKVTISSPESGHGYTNKDTLHATWLATDALSGVETESSAMDGQPSVPNGGALELVWLGGGNHEFQVAAKDYAHNAGSASSTFLVDVDIDGLLYAVDKVCGIEWVTKTGTCNSLRTKTLAAKASLAAGLNTDARGQLSAFLNELDAQQDKSVLDPGYRLLRADAQYVLVRYNLVPAI
jgi:hypothetical protein